MDELAASRRGGQCRIKRFGLVRTPIPAARQAQGLAGALALAGAGEGGFGDEVGRVAGGGRPGLCWRLASDGSVTVMLWRL